MVFLLDDDILAAIEINDLTMEELGAIQKIAQSYLDGIHNIYASPRLIIELSILSTLSITQRHAFKILSNNLLRLRQWEKIPYQIVVKHRTTFSKIREDAIIKFNVPLSYVNATQITHKPCLISESMKDCDYYFNMTMSLKENVTLFQRSSIQLRKVPGGGNDTGIALENEIEEGSICIVIADSDKKYPDCEEGGTLREIKRVIKRLEGDSEAIYEVKKLFVREKENLVPPELYKLTMRSKNYNAILDDLTSIYENEKTKQLYYYMDIKDGQRSGGFIECSKTQQLYEELYQQEVCASFKEIPTTFERLKEVSIEKEKLFNGVGVLIDEFEKDVFRHGLSGEIENKKKLSKDGINIPKGLIDELIEKERISKNPYLKLCDVLSEEWNNIVILVASFGCSPLERFI